MIARTLSIEVTISKLFVKHYIITYLILVMLVHVFGHRYKSKGEMNVLCYPL